MFCFVLFWKNVAGVDFSLVKAELPTFLLFLALILFQSLFERLVIFLAAQFILFGKKKKKKHLASWSFDFPPFDQKDVFKNTVHSGTQPFVTSRRTLTSLRKSSHSCG